MMKMKSLNLGRLFLLFIVLMLGGQQARADIHGVLGINGPNSGAKCADSKSWYLWIFTSEKFQVSSGPCSITSDGYVPKTGMYKVEMIIRDVSTTRLIYDASTNPFMLDATKTIAQQSVAAYGYSDSFSSVSAGTIICQYLVDSAGHRYTPIGGSGGCNDGDSSPLPPTPPIPDTACTLNDGNALNVNLGNVDRSQMPTVPGSGSMRHLQVPVDCTGGDVTVNMQLNYTPIVLSAGQVIKSSSNGLGVSVVYNSKILSSTDITPVTFTTGSNSMDLAFQAVRDPSVEIKDVPTGAFTASAVLVMTQQ
ncbi:MULTISPECIES: fimbrial protein [Rahnella]|uniref:Fimbrial protein n=1 Tax=Rahnella laticis TaxID=2787622 RepID=A0ABS0E7Y9_9GAMM|nr:MULTISPECIES: fimbrial protein [Rahnella]MBF7981217.1 fimbrial protein [Rahnella laticis]MBF8001309.1 fimbrial protein [Rahnella sp. LAC-M12]